MLRLETNAGIEGDKKKPCSKATSAVTGLGERYRLWKKDVDNKEADACGRLFQEPDYTAVDWQLLQRH
jgi:hypothetical protein